MSDQTLPDSAVFHTREPDIEALRSAYDSSLVDNAGYFDVCRQSYNERRCWWPGKSKDMRKHGADAFPWDGASDLEAPIIDERMNHLVDLFMIAVERANIRAIPTNARNVPRSKTVGGFLKWMSTSGYIAGFRREIEVAANHFLEKGIAITYVGWNREDKPFLQRISLAQIQEQSPEFAAVLADENSEEEAIVLLTSVFEGVTRPRAKKALKQLRNTGAAELPTVRRLVDAPHVESLSPDGEWVFPPYCTDPMRSPYGFWRTYYTVQELEGKVRTDGWDRDFVKMVSDRHRGVSKTLNEGSNRGRRTSRLIDTSTEAKDLVEIIYGYQRLVDESDGSEGIYCTVFHKDVKGDNSFGAKPYAKHELLNGYEDYPVVVTRLSDDTSNFYDAMTFPDMLRGIQNQVKVERDSRIDRNSMATLPPIMHPVNNAPTDWGPARRVPYRRKGEFEFGPVPQFDKGSVEMEQTLLMQADRLVGLDEESQISTARRQHLTSKFLDHVARVLDKAYKCFLRFGPDKVFFSITGANPQEFQKADPNENYYITVKFDVQDLDPESYDKKQERLAALTQLDRNGKLDINALLTFQAQSIDPVMADMVLLPDGDAKEKLLKDVTDDLAKIYAGIEVPPRPAGAEAALQIIQSYLQQPDVVDRLKKDEAFQERIQKYMQQYMFMIQQRENAETGKYGTPPAQMGGVRTQEMAG